MKLKLKNRLEKGYKKNNLSQPRLTSQTCDLNHKTKIISYQSNKTNHKA
jgi:hypothetical protein